MPGEGRETGCGGHVLNFSKDVAFGYRSEGCKEAFFFLSDLSVCFNGYLF